MNYTARHVASQNADFQNRIAQALIQHAVYLVFNSTDYLTKAYRVLDNPAHHAKRFAFWILGHATMDGLESVDELTDEQILEAVQAIWDQYRTNGE